MKKKLAALLVAVALVATACVGVTGMSACGGSPDIGVCLTDNSTTLNVAIGDDIQAIFPDKNVQVQSADNDVTTQISQINAFVTMGVDMLVVTPTEMGSIAETLQAARAQGIKVVISNANTDIDCYDAVTLSDEYLVGEYVALNAKKWADENLQDYDQNFTTVICSSSLNTDAINRSAGLEQIAEPYLKDVDGNYVDAAGNVVTEANKVDNPAYCSLINPDKVEHEEMSLDLNGTQFIQSIMTQYPDAKLILCYMSGFAPQMSQYIVDNSGTYDVDHIGIFGGGVSGSEPAYLLGSVSAGVGQSMTWSGTDYTGVKSIFRGAVSFGGTDAAQSVADLAYAVYYGTEGVDYAKTTTDAIGVWFSTTDSDGKQVLAVKPVSSPLGTPVADFDYQEALNDASTEIMWRQS